MAAHASARRGVGLDSRPHAAVNANTEQLRLALLEAQARVRDGQGSVMICLSGLPGAGKGDVLKTVNEWMDVRYLRTHAFHPPTTMDRQNPMMWRYWQVTPARGEIRFYVDCWHEQVVHQRARRQLTQSEMARALARIRSFEADLVASGVCILKFWLELSRTTQSARFEVYAAQPHERWRITDEDRWALTHAERLESTWETVRRATDSPWAPWRAIPESHVTGAATAVATSLVDAIQGPRAAPHMVNDTPPVLADALSSMIRPTRAVRPRDREAFIDRIDLRNRLPAEIYASRLRAAQGEFGAAMRAIYAARRAVVFVFEGFDAAGKGGAIRRLVAAVDPRQYQIIPVSAPDASARRHHWLWRFWRHVPRAGHLTVFDRSWYGRVLVERVEGFAREPLWCRAFEEINEFERQLTEHGVVLAKFWLHLSSEEQGRRFEARRQAPHKRHKITDEDLRNRLRRPDYERALIDMFRHTDTSFAPWHGIAAEDKRFARVEVLERATRMLNEALYAQKR